MWLLSILADLPDIWRAHVGRAAEVSLIIAIGWAGTMLGDAYINRQIARLDLGGKDNLNARKRATRLDVLRRIWIVVGAVATTAAALTALPFARQIGVSLFASAGIAGIAVGLAARPVLANLIAGLQIAFTQPIRIDDVVIVEGEWGWIEEVGLFYVVVRIWDWRRMVVPLSYFIEKPFQNWTRRSAAIIGTVYWRLDYRAPIGPMREKLTELCKASGLWDGDVVNLQVTESNADTIEVRALASASTSPEAWDLRCHLREHMLSWLQTEHPYALPRTRAEAVVDPGADWGARPKTTEAMKPPIVPVRDDSLTKSDVPPDEIAPPDDLEENDGG